MYVMNISSPERGFAGELRSPGEGALPSRAWEGGGLRGVLAIASQRCRFSRAHPPAPADTLGLRLRATRAAMNLGHRYLMLPGAPTPSLGFASD